MQDDKHEAKDRTSPDGPPFCPELDNSQAAVQSQTAEESVEKDIRNEDEPVKSRTDTEESVKSTVVITSDMDQAVNMDNKIMEEQRHQNEDETSSIAPLRNEQGEEMKTQSSFSSLSKGMGPEKGESGKGTGQNEHTAVIDEGDNHESGPTQSTSEERERRECETPEEIVQLMCKLNLNQQHKLTIADILKVDSQLSQQNHNQADNTLAYVFLKRLLTMNYQARYILCKIQTCEQTPVKPNLSVVSPLDENSFYGILSKITSADNVAKKENSIHPMDVQMAVFHCADRFLQQFMVTKLSQCQYALPLLVPNPFTKQIEFPLWTFRQIKKTWKTAETFGKVTSKTGPVYRAETPMVAFFRFGSVSSSKSQLMNSLINEKHNTFFHRHCPGSSKTRLLMDGVVEIAWYCSSGKDTDHFTDCVAFCNLHGDAGTCEKQREILTEMASVNVVLLHDLTENDNSMDIVQKLFDSPTPFICLLTDREFAIKQIDEGKYTMGFKDRSQSDVSADLRTAIKKCLSKSQKNFKLEDVGECEDIVCDEKTGNVKEGKETALQIVTLLKKEDLSKIKQKYLPCQGKLWHEWCQKNKELHRLQGEVEAHKSSIQEKMRQLREKQRATSFSELMVLFLTSLDSVEAGKKTFFVKWLEILLDDFSSDKLIDLHHEYNKGWSRVLELKKNHGKSQQQIISEQNKLESLSLKLNAALFGLEHIHREMGQIYEAWVSESKTKEEIKDISYLPRLAAEMMISGHPVELMDGDAAHVPLIWVTAVLDEVIKRLGDQRVFVLSVLGIQSSGKSTMLNAMFGLQFAVGAGRCTRGAFMQLLTVTEEMKEEKGFDYILIVDTEGLRALELAGMSTQHHDNALATFVVGLGNMTLINIFGENPAEMQDILQIVVQAFLRMKQVRLSPSCVFVHQNVGDITVGEKNMEGRRRLQEKLDEMTQLAAKEEDCDVTCFSNVISFDVQSDVKYFAQLWEGNPPMAPPNPSYSDNIQELKMDILSRGAISQCMTLSQFKIRIQNLWEALLNENFIFSFKNTLEIAVYRKLEDEYGTWTWTLRSAMQNTEDKLYTRIQNKKLHKIEEKELHGEMRETLNKVEESMQKYFEEDEEKDILIQWRGKFEGKIHEVNNDLVKRAKRKLEDIITQREICKNLDDRKTQYEGKLFAKSKELASKLKHKANDENELKREFSAVWGEWVKELCKDAPCIKDIDITTDLTNILSESYESNFVHERQSCDDYKSIHSTKDYSKYVTLKQRHMAKLWEQKPLEQLDQDSIRHLINTVINKAVAIVKSKRVSEKGYNVSYIQEITRQVKDCVNKHEHDNTKYSFKKEFVVDLLLHVYEHAGKMFVELFKAFKEANDPVVYLEKKKPEYYNVFRKYCQGATSVVVFGGLICSQLKEPILQSVYNKTTNDLAGEIRANLPAFNGNRSNLEKHILKSLAEEENFDKFMLYIHNPREHFENFIRDGVEQFMEADNPKALTMIKGHIKHKQQCIITAAQTATAQVKQNKGDANMWLKSFSDSLTDELEHSTYRLRGQNCQDITDFDLLEDTVKRELHTVIEELNSSFTSLSDLNMEMFRERPDEILIKHFSQCCWEQCPFCKAICTNTLEGHPGGHSVPFHRPNGLVGWHYREAYNFSIGFCTSLVVSDGGFYPPLEPNKKVPFKKYKSAGPPYSDWNITPDVSELPYWKWFMCRFQYDLENRYNRTFQAHSEIPSEWKTYTKNQAIESLYKYT